MTLRNLTEVIIAALRDHSSYIGVDADSIIAGPRVKESIVTPFCRVYVNPGDNTVQESGRIIVRSASVTILCGVEPTGDSATDTMTAFELAERVEAVMSKRRIDFRMRSNAPSITFDGAYADCVVAVVDSIHSVSSSAPDL